MTREEREKLRNQIKRDVARYLANGGKIKKLPTQTARRRANPAMQGIGNSAFLWD